MNANDKTVLFLFGRQPGEAALLAALALRGQLQRRGWVVQLAGLSAGAARVLRERFGQSAEYLAWGPVGLPVIGRLFLRRAGGTLVAVHAWDLEAAGAARAVAGHGVHLCVTLNGLHQPGQIAWRANVLRLADCIVCHDVATAGELSAAGVEARRVRVFRPAVDGSLLEAARAHRTQVLAALGLAENAGPVVVVPPVVQRGSGYFETAWGTFILRRGGIPARLVLPHPGRESSRILRFGAACYEQAGVAIARAGVSWLDLLAVADMAVLPDGARADAGLAAYALGSGRGVVVRSAGEPADPADNSLLSPRTCMFTADVRPLSLARALLRAWEDREATGNLARTAGQEVARQCDSVAAVETYLQIYSADSKYL